jgi:hypothetical protein
MIANTQFSQFGLIILSHKIMKNTILVLMFIAFALLTSKNAVSVDFANISQEETPKRIISDKTFACIRLYNFHTTETLKKGILKLYIGHRMGELSGGSSTLFGLHSANVRIGADLGLTDRISIGIGSSSQQKIYDGFIKFKVLNQSEFMPLTLTVVSNLAIVNSNLNIPVDEIEFWQKMNYYSSIMFSRKVNQRLSAQFDFSIIHRNMVRVKEDKNTIFALGTSLNYAINNSLSFAGEYNYLPNNQVSFTDVSSHILSFGLQVKKGPRHVFQIFFSNSSHQNEFNVISETIQKPSFKNLRLCFNLPTSFKVF